MTPITYENLTKVLKERTQEIFIVSVCTVFLLVTHAYRWMNAMFNHDSLLTVVQNDHVWQTALGRIFIPPYVRFRGEIQAPGNIAFLSGCFLICAVLLIVRILRIRKTVPVVLCCGFLTTFETLAVINASFLHDMDVYMLSLLFSVLAVYFLKDGNLLKNMAGAGCAAISLGLYQCFIETAILLVCIFLLRRLLEGENAKTVFLDGLRTAAFLFAAGILYYAMLRTVWHFTGITPPDYYNSLTKLKNLSFGSAAGLSLEAWKYTVGYLFRTPMIIHQNFSRYLNIILGMFTLLGVLTAGIRKRIGVPAAALVLLILLWMPLGGNVVYVLSQGVKQLTMTYSFACFPVFAVMILDMSETGGFAEIRAVQGATLVCAFLILNQFLFANQLYIRHDLYEQAGLSFMTRLVSRMEAVDEYEVGKTPVVILGHVDESPAVYDVERFTITYPRAGTVHRQPVSYYRTYQSYFRYILGYPVNMITLEEAETFVTNPEVVSMTVFPAEGSLKMVDGVLVIRLSENLLTEEMRGYY